MTLEVAMPHGHERNAQDDPQNRVTAHRFIAAGIPAEPCSRTGGTYRRCGRRYWPDERVTLRNRACASDAVAFFG